MKNALWSLIVVAVSCALMTGCCILLGNCSSQGLPTATIEAETSVGGIIQPWIGAYVEAIAVADSVDPGGYNCTIDTKGCVLSDNGPTDNYGDFPIQSLDIPGDWLIGIRPDTNCSQGAANQILSLTPSTKGDPTQIVCSDLTSGSATASPASCTETLNNSTGVMTSNCPSTITLSITTDTLPTAHALNISDYSDTGTQYYSFSGNASKEPLINAESEAISIRF